jgi:hypothetical protein
MRSVLLSIRMHALGVLRIRGAKLRFDILITYGTFIMRRATSFQIVPQIREHLQKKNGI